MKKCEQINTYLLGDLGHSSLRIKLWAQLRIDIQNRLPNILFVDSIMRIKTIANNWINQHGLDR